jgi:uncharacterized membrane protein YkvA (DUF1232 family)
VGEGAPAAAGAGAGFDPRAPLDPARALVPHTVKLNASLVRRRFLPKLRRLALHVPFAEDALALFFCALDPETPTRTKGLVLAGLAYFVLPTDVIPDWLPGLGFTDDAAVLAATVALAGRAIQPRHREQARAKLREFAGEPAPAVAG